MNAKRLLSGLLLTATVGCSGMNHTERGAVTGGAIGGILGTGIGLAAGRPGAGAAIGAGVGALTGGAIGNDVDKGERRVAAAQAHAARNPPLSVNDVVQLSQQRVADDIIIAQMDSTGSNYQLNTADIQHLHVQGVSDRVIRAMQTRRPLAMVPARPVGHVVIVEPPPPPPPVGFSIGYVSGPRRCW